jgi:tetratricopeptide (TPR) repeat protein
MNAALLKQSVLSAGLVLIWMTPAVLARSEYAVRDPFCVQPRGATVGSALLVEYFNALPEPEEGDTPEKFATRLEAALEKFRKLVQKRYTEGTLQRLLDAPHLDARRASALALGMFGTMRVNADLAARLRDGDDMVRRLASDALWAIWFRADSDENNKELQRLQKLRDRDKALTGLTELIKKAPNFAEAYNQRAILYYQKKDFPKSAADCEKVLQLNPHHFGAQSGLAQCLLNMQKPVEALKAYRKAYRLNPNMDGVADTIRMLENALGEDGKK